MNDNTPHKNTAQSDQPRDCSRSKRARSQARSLARAWRLERAAGSKRPCPIHKKSINPLAPWHTYNQNHEFQFIEFHPLLETKCKECCYNPPRDFVRTDMSECSLQLRFRFDSVLDVLGMARHDPFHRVSLASTCGEKRGKARCGPQGRSRPRRRFG